jgi:hypothetical protein
MKMSKRVEYRLQKETDVIYIFYINFAFVGYNNIKKIVLQYLMHCDGG